MLARLTQNKSAAEKVLSYWFSAGDAPNFKLWFSKSEETDSYIKSEFGEIHAQLTKDPSSIQDDLVAIIVLDQFSRNIYRDQPKCFEADPVALSLSKKLIDKSDKNGTELPPYHQMFAYMPLMHSENIEDQNRSVSLYGKLAEGHPQLKSAFDFAKDHQQIVERFGRFPHRNRILGRESTAEETEFLKTHQGF
jgi:uncharacterized protein (DUF924 family)